MAERTPARPGTIAAVALAVLALGGLQGSAAGAQTTEAVSSPSTTCHGTRPEGSLAGHIRPETPAETPLDRTLTYVDELVAGAHADVFTGLVVDEDGVAMDLYRMPSAALDKAVCDAAEQGVTVRLHDRDINERDLNALLARVSEDMTRWDGTFDLREVGLDGTGRVQIGVDDPGKAEPILRKAYGDHNAKYLVVEYAPQAHLL
ncbi:hypothetical protein PV518_31190 [Streptomyces sp. ND04-05B]|uniref:hypothetical protein n=1 Tax=Streptomyces sp. ND04-05B TaxID=3028693 RepID=UPI0029BCB5AA|nr:hypothetical protein [Streptomyces sp. ND04-05B]MDX3066592.1 hypothetical protein [Streptomyces sp. ND04-05B]